MDEQWSGSLHIGLTTLQPQDLPSCPLGGLAVSLPQLRARVTWLLAGSEVRRNGVLQRQNYGCSLDRLTVRMMRSLGWGCGGVDGLNPDKLQSKKLYLTWSPDTC